VGSDREFLTLRFAAIAPPPALVDTETCLLDALDRWDVKSRAKIAELRLVRAPPELLDHTMIVCRAETGAGNELIANGCAVMPGAAAAACVGELVERMATRAWAPSALSVCSQEQLLQEGRRVFAVDDYVGRPIFDGEWPFTRFSPSRELTWIEAEELATRDSVFVPVSLVRMTPASDSESLVETTSAGTAADFTLERATETALFELVERDALMRAWLRSKPLPSVPKDVVEALGLPQTSLSHPGLELSYLTTRSEFGPWVALVLLRCAGTYGAGASARPAFPDRLSRALAEALQGLVINRLAPPRRPLGGLPRTFAEHRAYYCDPSRFGSLASLESKETAQRSNLTANAASVVRRLHERGMSPIRIDLTGDQDHHVVRVLAPRLYAMEADYAAARLPARDPDLQPRRYRPHPFG
jgi:ribosomal protein S12 methylthiotransferase accessory factor